MNYKVGDIFYVNDPSFPDWHRKKLKIYSLTNIETMVGGEYELMEDILPFYFKGTILPIEIAINEKIIFIDLKIPNYFKEL